MNAKNVAQLRKALIQAKGKKILLAEINGKKIHGVIEQVNKDHVVIRMHRNGKTVHTKFFFPFFFPFFFFPFFF